MLQISVNPDLCQIRLQLVAGPGPRMISNSFRNTIFIRLLAALERRLLES